MVTKIEIEHETIQDLIIHLEDMKMKCYKEARRLKVDPLESDFPPGSDEHLGDNNCYGTRTVIFNYTEE